MGAGHGAIEEHYVIPTKVTEGAGVSPSKTLRFCCNCYQELQTWYSIKVNDMIYDSAAKQIRYRSPLEMVEEFQAVFNGFVNYKKRRRI